MTASPTVMVPISVDISATITGLDASFSPEPSSGARMYWLARRISKLLALFL